jgi:hypothetical protein
MSDEWGPGDGQAFPADRGFFHPLFAEWLPHVTSARRDIT